MSPIPCIGILWINHESGRGPRQEFKFAIGSTGEIGVFCLCFNKGSKKNIPQSATGQTGTPAGCLGKHMQHGRLRP